MTKLTEIRNKDKSMNDQRQKDLEEIRRLKNKIKD